MEESTQVVYCVCKLGAKILRLLALPSAQDDGGSVMRSALCVYMRLLRTDDGLGWEVTNAGGICNNLMHGAGFW